MWGSVEELLYLGDFLWGGCLQVVLFPHLPTGSDEGIKGYWYSVGWDPVDVTIVYGWNSFVCVLGDSEKFISIGGDLSWRTAVVVSYYKAECTEQP